MLEKGSNWRMCRENESWAIKEEPNQGKATGVERYKLVNTKVDGEQMKKELLVLKGLAIQWHSMLCVVFKGLRSSSCFAKGSPEAAIAKQEREFGVMMSSSCKIPVLWWHWSEEGIKY